MNNATGKIIRIGNVPRSLITMVFLILVKIFRIKVGQFDKSVRMLVITRKLYQIMRGLIVIRRIFMTSGAILM